MIREAEALTRSVLDEMLTSSTRRSSRAAHRLETALAGLHAAAVIVDDEPLEVGSEAA